MRVVRAIAWNTLVEALRDKVLYLLLFFGLFLFGASRLLAPLALGETKRITLDVGLSSISAFGCLIAIFVGHQLIFREVERKTLYFLFSRPIHRAQFVWGKFLGLYAILALSVVLMGAMLAAVLVAGGHGVDLSLLQALVLILVEMGILSAIAILIASFTSPILAGLFTLAGYLIGHGSGDLTELLARTSSPVGRGVVEGLRWILPRLDLYGELLPVLSGTGWSETQLGLAVAYGTVYGTACLLLAGVILTRRELAL
ncbi:MAG: ABC transporter permease [Candidatus Eisenbacteria bacterium]|uniref:ABC transporter permease n=1 Tax=Eiseniibacteriota bacterium TaxID=2212470 RepID=A0A956NEH7_UNCEI|nr:ABC transporter permease [Candidatus Eisenbacteria bacterium]MCB9462882.1 ABC transporter permease [Candidatus Eisenbacteria bacterium]